MPASLFKSKPESGEGASIPFVVVAVDVVVSDVVVAVDVVVVVVC